VLVKRKREQATVAEDWFEVPFHARVFERQGDLFEQMIKGR
jgi:hypothetical protein